MTKFSPTADALVEYCRTGRRICPQPQAWNRVWEMLPDRKQERSSGWNPSLPLILAAWHHATDLEKILRLREHIQWADEHGAISAIDEYIRGLSEEQWFHGND
jgi:hypothetical protein